MWSQPNTDNTSDHSIPAMQVTTSRKKENHPKMDVTFIKQTLTKAEESLLAHGPNFAVASRHTLYLDYIKAIETLCHKHNHQVADDVRSGMNRVLKGSYPPKPA